VTALFATTTGRCDARRARWGSHRLALRQQLQQRVTVGSAGCGEGTSGSGTSPQHVEPSADSGVSPVSTS